MKTVAINAHSVRAFIENSQILHGVNLSAAAGSWVSLVGPNGAGKSTLLKVLAGLLPHEGRVELLGQPLQALAPRRRAQALSWLGQAQSGGDDLSVYDLAMLGRLPHLRWLAAPGPADHAAVQGALQATQAWDWRHRRLGQLSGGERQRVLLARALAVEAQVLLMDEPLANLDPPHQSDWLALVRGLVASGKTVISVLHELTMALQADQMVILAQGRVTHAGATQDAATHRALEAVFGQRVRVAEVAGQFVVLPG
jgi:iron complex transport system ATP-binding protein